MTGKRRAVAAGLLLAAAFAASGFASGPPQAPPGAAVERAQSPSEVSQGSPAAARPPKERMEVYVLLAWAWLSIGVLLVLVRLRVREADRTFRMGLYRGAAASPPRDPER